MSMFSSSIRDQLSLYVESVRSSDPSRAAEDILSDVLGMFEAEEPARSVEHGAPAIDMEDAKRCDARVWNGWNESKMKMAGGFGSRCAHEKSRGGKFCATHQKKADVTCVPCSFWEECDEVPKGAKVGGKKGLHYGEWGSEFPILSEDGSIAIVWKEPSVAAKIIEMMVSEGKTYHPCTSEGRAGKTAPPRATLQKKSAPKKKTPTKKRQTSAKQRWMKAHGRTNARTAINELYARTHKFPDTTLMLLAENNLDVDAAFAAFEELTPAAWATFCEEWLSDRAKLEGADELGNFEKDLTHKMLYGLTSKLATKIWKALPESEKQLYEDAKTAADAANETPAATVEATKTKKATKTTKKAAAKTKKAAKKAKPIVVAPPPTPPSSDDEDSDEEEEAVEYKLADGTMVFVDSEWNAYNEDCEELGVVDPKTRTMIDDA